MTALYDTRRWSEFHYLLLPSTFAADVTGEKTKPRGFQTGPRFGKERVGGVGVGVGGGGVEWGGETKGSWGGGEKDR